MYERASGYCKERGRSPTGSSGSLCFERSFERRPTAFRRPGFGAVSTVWEARAGVSLVEEWLGYVDGGGSQVIVHALVNAIESQGGVIRCETPVEGIVLENGWVVGARAGGLDYPADALLSTIPLPILVRIGQNLPEEYRRAALDLGNIGVRCIILKTKERVTPYFWVNVNDDAVPIVGLIEYTNLNPPEAFGGHHLIYSPRYVSSEDPEYPCRPDEEVFEETVRAISEIRRGFDRESVIDYRVFRTPYAQPVCPVGFSRRLAPIRTPVPNLVAGDTSHLLPPRSLYLG